METNPKGCDDDILSSDLDKPQELDNLKFCNALCKFVMEIRKHNSDNYPPNSFHEIICCIQMYLCTKKVVLYLLYILYLLYESDPIFGDLYNVMDNVMKQSVSEGLGVVKSATPISLSLEEEMWNTGMLGEHQPKQLSDMIIFLLGLNLARGCVEQKHL